MIGKGFLRYINSALIKYECVDEVKQVSGFLFPIQYPCQNKALFLPLTNTIGWGTWKRAWEEIDFEAKGYEQLKKDKSLRKKFNLDGVYDFSKMLIRQMENDNYGSWAIIYWWTVFNKDGKVLYPDYSFIQHNDFDKSGEHAAFDDYYNHNNWNNEYTIDSFPESTDVNSEVLQQIQKHLSKYSKYSIQNILIKLKQFLKIK